MNTQKTKRISKFLSLVLRHQPEIIGIRLSDAGWVDTQELLAALWKHGYEISLPDLEQVVASNDKQRFSFSEDRQRIRAKQGHSVEVELGYQPAQPPTVLYHGTPSKHLKSIQKTGLQKMNRHHVHLHTNPQLAKEVGNRRGRPVLLSILSQDMHRAGYVYFVTENDVWLTDHVPVEFISFP